MLKDERIYRSSLRGLKKCPSCNHFNGNRAKGCININCPLHFLKKLKKKTNSFDPIQLITYNDTRIYSVRNKEREPLQRNFVQITDTTLSSDKDGSIISRNAICYVDTCKYDSNDINLSCKHVKSATTDCQIYAQDIKISKDILFNMNIDNNLKINLWNLYNFNELIIPSIQRINKSLFVVKCIKNINFPAGLLHIIVKSDDDIGDFNYGCSCKKLKILLSPNNTVVLKNDICDHLLLLLAGILSSQHLQNQFQNLLNTFKTFWNQNDFQHVFDNDDFLPNGDFYNFTDGILNSVIELNNTGSLPGNIFHDDITSTTNNLQISLNENDNNINSIHLVDMSATTTTATTTNQTELLSNITNDKLNSSTIPTVPIINENNECLELTDCQIELMDQFKLTDQIELCNYDVLMNTDEFMEIEKDTMNLIDNQDIIGIEELSSNQNDDLYATIATELATTTTKTTTTATTTTLATNDIVNINQNKSLVNQIKTGTIISKNKRKHNDYNQNELREKQQEQKQHEKPILEFNEWLEFVIEQINMSIDANTKDTNIKHVFSTKNDFFDYLSQKFSVNGKRRIPNATIIIKNGKLKGLPQSKWIFNSPSIIKKIFNTQESQIEIERYFMGNSDGSFKLYDKNDNEINSNNLIKCPDGNKFKKILPDLLSTYIKFEPNSKEKNRNAFIIEWIPNVFPKSRFGIMKIEFSIGFKKCKKT